MTKLFDKELTYLQDNSGKLNLFSIFLPILLQYIFSYLLGTVHTYLMTEVSPEAVAAIGVTNAIITAVGVLANFTSLGGQVLISIELGKGDNDKVKKIFGGCVVATTLLFGVVVCLILVAAPNIIKLYHLTGNTYDYAINYFKIRIAFALITAYSNCFSAVLRCYGKTLSILSSALTLQTVNIVLSLVAVKSKLNNLYTVRCMALASGVAQMIDFIILLSFALKIIKPNFKINFKVLKDICILGFPAVFGNLSYQICNAIITSIIASFNIKTINTNIFTNNISTYANIISLALAPANSVMLGRLFGKKDFEKGKRMVAQNAVISFVFNVGISVLILVFCNPLMHIFTNDLEIISLAFKLFAIDIVMEAFRSFSHIYGESALICAKDTIFTSIVGIVVSWIFGVGGCLLFCNSLGWGLIGARFALLLNEGCKSIIYFVRWEKGTWLKNF